MMTPVPDDYTFQCGDWVCYYAAGRLHIDEVCYIFKDQYTYKTSLATANGVVIATEVFEVRSKNG